jgi:hypothetical protein
MTQSSLLVDLADLEDKTEDSLEDDDDDFIRNKLELLKINENKSIASLYYSKNSKANKNRNEYEGFHEEDDQVNGRRIRNIAIKMTERIKRFVIHLPVK